MQRKQPIAAIVQQAPVALVALVAGAVLALGAATTAVAQTSGKKPNIPVIMTDDVGVWNVLTTCVSVGMPTSSGSCSRRSHLGRFLVTLKEFPQRQKSASLNRGGPVFCADPPRRR
ncbi:MAG: hypothetical protein WCB10_13780 [Steroidobacteraceae bacterium]